MVRSGGVGLAAPQVGVPLRAFVAMLDGRIVRAANPTLTVLGTTNEDEEPGVEGCLSLHGESYLVRRHNAVLLACVDENLEPLEMVLSGFAARVAQHEVDHLEGYLISDRGQRLRTP